MNRKTEPPLLDVTQIVPSLACFQRTAIRLHPTPVKNLSGTVSQLGGVFWWPKNEPWPRGDRREPYCGILQLLRADVPELPWQGDENLLQLLWCPRFTEQEKMAPHGLVRWWSWDPSIETQLPPPKRKPEEDLVPHVCSLMPERVMDYPHYSDLDPTLFDSVAVPIRINPNSDIPEVLIRIISDGMVRPEDFRRFYSMAIGPCRGTKLLGHCCWLQDPIKGPVCEKCGQKMDILATLATSEPSPGSRWGGPLNRTLPFDEELWQRTIQPSGLNLWGGGYGYWFYCASCPDRPTAFLVQYT